MAEAAATVADVLATLADEGRDPDDDFAVSRVPGAAAH
jgi:hypothetical protein